MPKLPKHAHKVRVGLYGRNSKPPKGWKPSFRGEQPPGSWKIQIARLRAQLPADADVVWEGYDVVTGSDPNRPKWAELLRLVRGGHVQHVYVTKLDRVMRGLNHFLDVSKIFDERGAHLIFVDSQGASIRGKDPFAKAMRNNIAVFAELELDLARERAQDVMRVGDDGRTYGPRSERPAGRPSEYGEGHKMRRRGGRLVHDRPRCALCRGITGGFDVPSGNATPKPRVAKPVGYATGVGSA